MSLEPLKACHEPLLLEKMTSVSDISNAHCTLRSNSLLVACVGSKVRQQQGSEAKMGSETGSQFDRREFTLKNQGTCLSEHKWRALLAGRPQPHCIALLLSTLLSELEGPPLELQQHIYIPLHGTG